MANPLTQCHCTVSPGIRPPTQPKQERHLTRERVGLTIRVRSEVPTQLCVRVVGRQPLDAGREAERSPSAATYQQGHGDVSDGKKHG